MAGPTRADLAAWAEEEGVELIFFEPAETFDPALLGVVVGFGQAPAVLYDEDVVLAALTEQLGAEDAVEWFAFNTIGAYLGEATPRFLRPIT